MDDLLPLLLQIQEMKKGRMADTVLDQSNLSCHLALGTAGGVA